MDKEKLYFNLIILGSFILSFFVLSSIKSLWFLIGVALTFVFICVASYLMQKEQNKKANKMAQYNQTVKNNNAVENKPDYTDNDFNEWLKKFEPYTKMAAGLIKTTKKTNSKFGGMPNVSPEFVWPTFKGKPIPFLLQIDFSEVNANNILQNFPTSGIMYVFVDSELVNTSMEYKEGECYKVLYCENSNELIEVEKPADLSIVYKEFNIEPKITKTYPDPEDCDEADELYCNRPFGGMDDDYDDLRYDNSERHMLGGWATYIQSGGYCEGENGSKTLLLQIGYEDDDDNFMWGDCGNLYFFIDKTDLINCNFNNVMLDMQCG